MALIMPRTWKAALAPFLAGIPERIGFAGEGAFHPAQRRALRRDEAAAHGRSLRGMLALPRGAAQPPDWPLPELDVPASRDSGLADPARPDREDRPIVALAPGRGRSLEALDDRRLLAALARGGSTAEGAAVWVVGRPGRETARRPRSPPRAARSTSPAPTCAMPSSRSPPRRLRSRTISGLLHVAAATGTPSIGIFGPTSPWHWAPLNPLAAVIETASELPCRPCHKPVCRLGHHRCMRDIAPDQVLTAARDALAKTAAQPEVLAA